MRTRSIRRVFGAPGWGRRALIVVAFGSLGGCYAAMPYIDLPPGDWYGPSIQNDTASEVVIGDCSSPCTRFADHVVSYRLKAGEHTTDLLANVRGGSRFLVQLADSGAVSGVRFRGGENHW